MKWLFLDLYQKYWLVRFFPPIFLSNSNGRDSSLDEMRVRLDVSSDEVAIILLAERPDCLIKASLPQSWVFTYLKYVVVFF